MVRIIYRWRVRVDNEVKFRDAWARATIAIRENTSGARGSVLLKSFEDSTVFITVARWESLEAWQAFWRRSSRPEMNAMHAVAERLSEEAFDEIEDHTT